MPLIQLPSGSTLACALSATLNREEGLDDIALYFGPEKELLRVNSFVLKASSSVFWAMFDSGLKEVRNNKVYILDINPFVGKEMVIYMCIDKCQNHGREFVACCWKIWPSRFESTLWERACKANQLLKCSKISAFAGQFCGDGEFKDFILSFITKDKDTCSVVMRSQEWKEVCKFPELVLAVSDKFFDMPLSQQQKRLIYQMLMFGPMVMCFDNY